MSRYEDELRMYESFNRIYRERELRQERGEEEPPSHKPPMNEFTSSIAAEIYADRKKARVDRVKVQRLFPPIQVHNYEDEEDDEEQHIRKSAALLDETYAASVYEQRKQQKLQRK